jgi:hypothetical protein
VRNLGRVLVLAGVVATWAVAGQGKSLDLKSAWSPAPVKVDGTGQGWSANFAPLGDPPILVSLENDAQYLYLCVRTSDRKVKAQIVSGGLTVWAEVPGTDAGGMGVRFPMRGLPPGGERPRHGNGGAPPPGGYEPERPPQGNEGEPPKEPPASAIDDVSTEFELLGPTREDRLVVARDPDQPLQVAVGDDSGVLVYQVRLPLQPSDEHPVAIGAAAGTTMTLVLDSTAPKRKGRPEGGEGGPEGGPPSGGGAGPGGYGPGGGMGGPHGGGMGGHHGGEGLHGEGYKSFKVNLTVTLAPAPAKPQ